MDTDQDRSRHGHERRTEEDPRYRAFETLFAVYLDALILSGILLGLQFGALIWGYLDPGSVNGKMLWLNPGLACALGSTLATLRQIFIRRRRRTVP